ncbi:hypothetical protein COU20_00475 [Candidatus Kaiserbacteria bacterium CG10_big_fil_rev_8_21_14_0_10_59_10]|uniref:50S ribosomal protein L35 n=1 Tax=Candidatus Kaiserbacteria bacterium CG10_big_fil_rev_8_21_14_0_10_59_10 TaxID=1974612 RepID=A0A2H0U8Q8_9BACT|nr:MAG: hypothetical protein COU20_00475 [Candidatus Kaiserbacteria bacterium CG10_big_fil_rev_8_21_14_0_10_59_10]
MKSNKSYNKRLRVTRRGKIISRVPGHNHFNAKDSGTKRQQKRRPNEVGLSNLERSRYLPN